MKDFSFQGKIYLGARLAGGRPGALRWVGDAPVCTIALSTESETRRESYSGQRMPSATLSLGNNAEITLTLNYAEPQNLALGLYGSVSSGAGGTATDEALPADLVAGDTVVLDRGSVTDLVLTDSTASPVTLEEGTHYEIESAEAGTIRLLDVSTLEQPILANYTYGASQDVTMFTTTPPERYLLLDGINTIDGSRIRARLYRVKFNPLTELPLINDTFGQIELTGAVLFDSDAAMDDALGGFGKLELPEAA